jgi:hypothetical protein
MPMVAYQNPIGIDWKIGFVGILQPGPKGFFTFSIDLSDFLLSHAG